ncbi:MAG: hypothetical protein Q9181_003461, partial [Wetmoreana brouardii]
MSLSWAASPESGNDDSDNVQPVKRSLAEKAYQPRPTIANNSMMLRRQQHMRHANNATMSDPPKPKKASVPDWQQEEAPALPETSDQDSESPEKHADPLPPRTALLQQASKFLNEDEIKDAPAERKVAFLQSKGLTEEETHRLLEQPSNVADVGVKGAELEHSEAASPQAPQREDSISHRTSPSSTKDIPPIITYPEFLIHSRKPPSLITASRLINTFYLFSGAAAAVYGTSKYIAQPMLESLTAARHSLLEAAQTNLDTLNDKLEKNISIIPRGVSELRRQEAEEGEEDNGSEVTEDMAALFCRTVGTQTSPSHSPSTSLSSSISSTARQPDATLTHQSSLHTLHTSLSALLPSKDTDRNNVISQLDDLKTYLDSLAYSSLYTQESKDNAVSKFKAEIRGVKGVLLNARNFPAGPPGR